jgi:hypothetical protein
LDENRIRFSKLYADRAAAIKDLYSLLVELEDALQAFVLKSEDLQCGKAAKEAFGRAADFYKRSRILFTASSRSLVEQLFSADQDAKLNAEFGGSLAWTAPSAAAKVRALDQALAGMKETIPGLRRQLEEDFREALGMPASPNVGGPRE